MRENRLRWFGYVIRSCKNGLEMNVDGSRGRGRLKKWWLDMIKIDMRVAGVSVDDVRDRA